MEFWGVEVKPGKSTKVRPEFGKVIHISHASLGECNKDGNGSVAVPLRLKIDGKDFVVGTLVPEDRPQLMFDLVCEKEFELSHAWKNGSVYFLGYNAEDYYDDDDVYDDELVENKENDNTGGVFKSSDESLSGDSSDDISEQASEEDDDSESEEELPKPSKKRSASSSVQAAAAKKAKPSQSTKSRAQ